MKKQKPDKRRFYVSFSDTDNANILLRIADLLLQKIGIDAKFNTLPDLQRFLVNELPVDYNRPHREVVVTRQLHALYSKNPSWPTSVNPTLKAYNDFSIIEDSCKKMNQAICENRLDYDTNTLLNVAKRRMKRLLYSCPSLNDLNLTFGSGSNSGVAINNNSSELKLGAHPTISSSAQGALQTLWNQIPLYAFQHVWTARTAAGKVAFIPKNHKTDRTIMLEPSLNTMVQRGIGTYMKDIMLESGINLRDQTVNRNRARVGSISGEYATIDMTSASDYICYFLVKELLDEEWFELLNTWRTPDAILKDPLSGRFSYHTLEKFSSMGNGFTFELQSAIFYCLAYAVCKEAKVTPDISIFGDDLIVPTSVAGKIFDLFEKIGFVPNREKSYCEGDFRESCGGDYLRGINIRPFYVKDKMSPAVLTIFHNFALRTGMTDLALLLASYIPEAFRLFGPCAFGDGHLHVPSFIGTKHKRSNGFCGYVFKAFKKVPKINLEKSWIGENLLPFYEASRIVNKTNLLKHLIEVQKGVHENVRGGTISREISIYYLEVSGADFLVDNYLPAHYLLKQ